MLFPLYNGELTFDFERLFHEVFLPFEGTDADV